MHTTCTRHAHASGCHTTCTRHPHATGCHTTCTPLSRVGSLCLLRQLFDRCRSLQQLPCDPLLPSHDTGHQPRQQTKHDTSRAETSCSGVWREVLGPPLPLSFRTSDLQGAPPTPTCHRCRPRPPPSPSRQLLHSCSPCWKPERWNSRARTCAPRSLLVGDGKVAGLPRG